MNLNSSPFKVNVTSVFSLVKTECISVSSRSSIRNFFLESRIVERCTFRLGQCHRFLLDELFRWALQVIHRVEETPIEQSNELLELGLSWT